MTQNQVVIPCGHEDAFKLPEVDDRDREMAKGYVRAFTHGHDPHGGHYGEYLCPCDPRWWAGKKPGGKR